MLNLMSRDCRNSYQDTILLKDIYDYSLKKINNHINLTPLLDLERSLYVCMYA